MNENFLEILSRQNEKINFGETLSYRNSFPKYHGTNKPPCSSYEKLNADFVCNYM